ncbi:DNA excision repair protein ERCC-1 isoform X2 [Hippopotamus amphibius kiboko]|uniref:DNA excision repair protein ERCC-1 isoform X2 n=1 Tax=Hippopotamus amphibius kiboko TaxID=575201 RepID=UPI002592C96E|nr:DNA excision repair protein ERCC-1 isoform X2 [Hippopotamus amphibius kiboko]
MNDETMGQEPFLPSGGKRMRYEPRAARAIFATSRKVFLRKRSEKYDTQRWDSELMSSFELLDAAMTEAGLTRPSENVALNTQERVRVKKGDPPFAAYPSTAPRGNLGRPGRRGARDGAGSGPAPPLAPIRGAAARGRTISATAQGPGLICGQLCPQCLPHSRSQKDLAMDEEGVQKAADPPARKKFLIPMDQDEVPPPGAKALFKSTRRLPTVEPAPQPTPQTYAEYAISGPLEGAGATRAVGPEPLAGETPNQAPKPGAKSNSITVSPRQRGNPVLRFVRNVPWEFGDVLPDYVLGQSTCALFLSLRYHNLHPDYIHQRLQSLGKSFALRVLLVQVDVKDPQQALKELAKMCILADCTLILAWRRLDWQLKQKVDLLFNAEIPPLGMSPLRSSPPVCANPQCCGPSRLHLCSKLQDQRA